MTAPELLLKAAKELAEYASYAEISGGVSVNRPQVRRWCDAVFDIIRALPKDEWGEPTLASSPEVSALIAEARREWCKKMDRIADEIDEQVKVTRAYVGDCGMDHNQKELMKICTSHFLDKAATIRALKETTHD